jgi:ABC-2 type transport system permease protein
MKAIWATITAAVAEARANRAALWTQVAAMIVNDVAWVAFWGIFFHRVGTVGGWDTSRVLLLFAILTTSAGLVLGLLSNARRVGRLAADGELDAALALPVSPLAYVLVRRIDTVNLGDFVFGVGLFFAACSPTPARFALYVVGSLTSAAMFTGFLVTIGSIAFFAGTGEIGDFGLNAMLLLASYPIDIVAGASKVLLYSVVPAAFIATVPAGLVASFSLGKGLVFLAASITFVFVGWATFTLGLRRYTSGAVWTRA